MKENTRTPENNDDLKKVPKEETDVSQDKEKQQRSDPNITELKGFVDPNEELEPKGTDNKTSL